MIGARWLSSRRRGGPHSISPVYFTRSECTPVANLWYTAYVRKLGVALKRGIELTLRRFHPDLLLSHGIDPTLECRSKYIFSADHGLVRYDLSTLVQQTPYPAHEYDSAVDDIAEPKSLVSELLDFGFD